LKGRVGVFLSYKEVWFFSSTFKGNAKFANSTFMNKSVLSAYFVYMLTYSSFQVSIS